MGKGKNSDIHNVKKRTIEIMGEYIRTWINMDSSRTIDKFAEISGVSTRTIKSIINYKTGKKKPNPRMNTIDAIIDVLNMEVTLTPKEDKDVIK